MRMLLNSPLDHLRSETTSIEKGGLTHTHMVETTPTGRARFPPAAPPHMPPAPPNHRADQISENVIRINLRVNSAQKATANL